MFYVTGGRVRGRFVDIKNSLQIVMLWHICRKKSIKTVIS